MRWRNAIQNITNENIVWYQRRKHANQNAYVVCIPISMFYKFQNKQTNKTCLTRFHIPGFHGLMKNKQQLTQSLKAHRNYLFVVRKATCWSWNIQIRIQQMHNY